MTKQTVLVTGAAGFIGSHLTDRLLEDGARVIGVDNFCDFYEPAAKQRNIQGALKNDRFTLASLDIRDKDSIASLFDKERPTAVIHLAAMAGVRPSIEQPAYYTAVNLDGTVNLLDAAVATGVSRFVFASSSSVYGNNEKTPFAETDNVDQPISPYAATKRSGELLCHTYWHLHKLPLFCLRFFTVFGPRQRPDLAISKFLRMVDAGEEIPMFGDGTTSRDYTFVGDIVTGIVSALNRCDRYRIYNIGGSSPVSLRELIDTVGQVIGKTPIVKQMPMQPGDVDRTWADLTRAESELDYRPTTSLRDGIAQQWQWMKSL